MQNQQKTFESNRLQGANSPDPCMTSGRVRTDMSGGMQLIASKNGYEDTEELGGRKCEQMRIAFK